MPIEIGHVEAVFRYPVKSMAGERIETAFGEGTPRPPSCHDGDERCGMVNLDPDSARPAPEVIKAVVRANQNNGIYGAVTRTGRLAVGQTIFLRGATKQGG